MASGKKKSTKSKRELPEHWKAKPSQARVDAGLVEDDYEKQPQDEATENDEAVGDVGPEGPISYAPSSAMNPNVSEEEQGMEMTPVLVGPPSYGSPDPLTTANRLVPLADHPLADRVSEDYGAGTVATSNDEVDATAGAKELADENGVDLSQVQGTGEGGRVTKSDVEDYLNENA